MKSTKKLTKVVALHLASICGFVSRASSENCETVKEEKPSVLTLLFESKPLGTPNKEKGFHMASKVLIADHPADFKLDVMLAPLQLVRLSSCRFCFFD